VFTFKALAAFDESCYQAGLFAVASTEPNGTLKRQVPKFFSTTGRNFAEKALFV